MTSHMTSVPEGLRPGETPVLSRLSGQAKNPISDDVALDLISPARDGDARATHAAHL
jgi:hypothetical protein